MLSETRPQDDRYVLFLGLMVVMRCEWADRRRRDRVTGTCVGGHRRPVDVCNNVCFGERFAAMDARGPTKASCPV